MRVLVTRPAAFGEQLTRQLCAAGIDAWHFPLIDFLPGNDLNKLPVFLNRLHCQDSLFVLSQQAVDQAQAQLQRVHQRWPHVQAFAPGRTTAQALQQVSGLTVDYPTGREASELLLQLPATQQMAGRQVLILRGNGGRELLPATLAARGAQVTVCECYRRQRRIYCGDEQSRHWQQLAIDTLVVTSGEILQQLYALVPVQQHRWLLQCRLVVISERLAKLAHRSGWQQITIADNAGNDALLSTLLDTRAG